MSLLPYIKADLFLTGDIKYHEAVEAKSRGISLIDIAHYESEIFFVDCMYKAIKHFNIEIIKLKQKNPFMYSG
jgi:putative NIF3 family GTP cyclohydrolase 1 type 2